MIRTLIVAAGLVALAGYAGAAELTPLNLRCDYAINSLGVDSAVPRLFWELAGQRRGQSQTAYEIQAASTSQSLADGLADLWDSGKVNSDATIQVAYAGRLPGSDQTVFWRVRVWDGQGAVSDWSKPATWTTGVLAPSDWHAHWIGGTNTDMSPVSWRLRREFTVRPGLRRAIINVCGLGQYVLTLNGARVDDDFLSPGWTKYDHTCLYDTRDITSALQAGGNAVGLELGNGMYRALGWERYTKFKNAFGPQQAIAQIRLEYQDGSVEYVGTDQQWQAAPGPIVFSSIYGGEDEDARREMPGWDKAGFAAPGWRPAALLSGPGGVLRGLSCAAPPIRVQELHPVVSSWTLTNGDVVYDLGQNAAHVPQVTVTGPAGATVRLSPAELTNLDGTISQGSMGGGKRGGIWCEYTKGTDGPETWAPKFYYAGSRYWEAKVTGGATVVKLTGLVIQSASTPTGEFSCSSDLFNRIRQLVRWAQRNNMVSVLTDCPHRERLGWLEQDHLNGPSLRYEFGLDQLGTKILNDIGDSQLANGLVPTTAPEYAVFRNKSDPVRLRNLFGDSPEWSSSFLLIPWQQYEFAGDQELFRRHYAQMQAYLDYLSQEAKDNIVSFGLGDWYDLGPKKPGVSQLTPIALTATAFYYEDAKVLATAAKWLGQAEDARRDAALAEQIRASFNAKFYDETNGWYATDSQCANAIPLVMGLCAETNRDRVLAAIVKDVRARGNGLTAGDVGYRYLLRALADGGRNDVIFDLNNRTDQPGYGMQLRKGKTSLTEAWDGGSSQDHFMLGQIEEWFYHDLAGIQNAPDSPGFKQLIIAPHPVGDVTWVKASYHSLRGPIAVEWRQTEHTFELNFSLPPNTSATVLIPSRDASTVTEGDRPARESDGVTFLRLDRDCAVFRVGSGTYHFAANR